MVKEGILTREIVVGGYNAVAYPTQTGGTFYAKALDTDANDTFVLIGASPAATSSADLARYITFKFWAGSDDEVDSNTYAFFPATIDPASVMVRTRVEMESLGADIMDSNLVVALYAQDATSQFLILNDDAGLNLKPADVSHGNIIRNFVATTWTELAAIDAYQSVFFNNTTPFLGVALGVEDALFQSSDGSDVDLLGVTPTVNRWYVFGQGDVIPNWAVADHFFLDIQSDAFDGQGALMGGISRDIANLTWTAGASDAFAVTGATMTFRTGNNVGALATPMWLVNSKTAVTDEAFTAGDTWYGRFVLGQGQVRTLAKELGKTQEQRQGQAQGLAPKPALGIIKFQARK